MVSEDKVERKIMELRHATFGRLASDLGSDPSDLEKTLERMEDAGRITHVFRKVDGEWTRYYMVPDDRLVQVGRTLGDRTD